MCSSFQHWRLPGNYLPHSVSGGRIGVCRRIGNEEWIQKGLVPIGIWSPRCGGQGPPDGSQAASNWQRIIRCKDISTYYMKSKVACTDTRLGDKQGLWCFHRLCLDLMAHPFLAGLKAYKITVKIRGDITMLNPYVLFVFWYPNKRWIGTPMLNRQNFGF